MLFFCFYAHRVCQYCSFSHLCISYLFSFLLLQIFLAKDTAVESRESRLSQEELWDRISRDDYMKYAVEECFFTIQLILTSVLDDEGKKW